MNKQETPWGCWEILLENDECKVKRITVKPGQRLSYQKHKKRQEVWTIVNGTATVVLNDETKILSRGDMIAIPKEAAHRIGNQGNDDVVMIEVQTGEYFGEDDIIRLSDDYGRSPSS